MKKNSTQTGRITKIEQQKRNKKRFNIYINEEYSFSIHEDVMVHRSVSKNQEIDAVALQQILVEEEKVKAEHAGLRFLSYRPRTVWEMKQYLMRKEYEPELVSQLLQLWESQGYLNDRQFALSWAKERISFKKKGSYLIKEELKQKGIDPHIIMQTLQEIEKEDEFNACYELLEKKQRRLTPSVVAEQLEDVDNHRQIKREAKNKQKLFTFLARRGFSLELIQEAYKHWLQMENETEEDTSP